MYLNSFRTVSLFVLMLFFLPSVRSQQAQEPFGKNRIQYKNFNWQYISTYNFEIYYYDGGKELAQAAANFAETDFQKIVEQTGFTPYSRIKILVYNTVSELQQSNIGIEDASSNIGGQTQFVKSKIEVGYKGSHAEFRTDLRFHIAQMMINVMLYGGSLKDIVQSSYLMALPDWYVNGASQFIAEGWSSEMDNYMRDLVINKDLKKPTVFSGKDATAIGHSIWNYVAQKYGIHNVANILNLTRIVRNEEASIESSLGVPYHAFIRDWKEYYKTMGSKVINAYQELPEKSRVIRNRRGNEIRSPRLSQDGKWMAYSRSYRGKYDLILYNTETGKKKIIREGGHKLLNQQEDPNVIVHNWITDKLLAYIENKKNKLYLRVYDVATGKTQRRELKELTQVHDFSVNSSGDRMVMSAAKAGQSDLFLYLIQDNSLKQITNDLFDDIHPSFIPGTSRIVFSSNRNSDTLKKGRQEYKNIQPYYSIFILDNYTPGAVMKRIQQYGNNIRPVPFSKDEILYLSNEKGINNIYRYSISQNTSVLATAYIRNVDDFDYHSSGVTVIQSLHDGKSYLYVLPQLEPLSGTEFPMTDRQNYLEEQTPRVKEVQVESLITDSITSTSQIDINDFKFESEVLREQKRKEEEEELFLSGKNVSKKNEITFRGPSRYNNVFGLDKVNSTLMIDPLRGLGVLMEAEMSDMMGNHRMNAGLFGLTDLKSSSVFGEYFYLKKRLDFKVRYERKTIFAFNESVNHRYTLNKLSPTISYPLSVSERISFTPFVASTRYTELVRLDTADVTVLYGGLRGEFVFDNTVVTGMNMIEGTRAKVGIEQYFAGDKAKNFGKLVVDFRHYEPIHRNIILAVRASYGQFFGNAKKNFLLGGMDNWLFNSTTSHGAGDPLALNFLQGNSDLLFVEYVTNMRGFNYNTQYGSKYALLNAEVRVPLFKYLYRGVIHSNFLKNFQATAFTDIGSAWTGKNPFSTDNSTNTISVGGGSNPFTATVVNYKNPFLWGYGLGVRSLFLGYYVKFDVGWGVADGRVEGRRYYLTFGYDF